MAYGSGGASPYSGNNQRSQDGLSNRYSSPYQKTTSPDGGRGYNPPSAGATYAQQQTQTVEDTMRTHYETEATSAAVLTQMRAQRGQLQGAHDNVWEMRQAAEKAKQDITIMAKKVRRKKRRLQAVAILLAFVDFILFIRLIECGGSFFCKKKNNGNNGYY